jgi:type I restriction enzyme S subunit
MLFQKVGRSAHGTRTLISPELAKFFVPVPPPEEQKVIATIMHAIDRKVSVHERRRAALSDLFLTLLNQLMTTQIRVDKLDIDTSEVTA